MPSFGDWSTALVGTVGLNPSSKEFQDSDGAELEGDRRRLHTLRSLGIAKWTDAGPHHLGLVMESCRGYFGRNPYDAWFRCLDWIIAGTAASFYTGTVRAAHLDLIPFATACKWTELRPSQRRELMQLTGDTLGLLLRESPIRVLILNGMTVVSTLEKLSGERFNRREQENWGLRRGARDPVRGFSFRGAVETISGVSLGRKIAVLGFNHNLQSSFGVTSKVRTAIRDWIAKAARGLLE